MYPMHVIVANGTLRTAGKQWTATGTRNRTNNGCKASERVGMRLFPTLCDSALFSSSALPPLSFMPLRARHQSVSLQKRCLVNSEASAKMSKHNMFENKRVFDWITNCNWEMHTLSEALLTELGGRSGAPGLSLALANWAKYVIIDRSSTSGLIISSGRISWGMLSHVSAEWNASLALASAFSGRHWRQSGHKPYWLVIVVKSST